MLEFNTHLTLPLIGQNLFAEYIDIFIVIGG